MTESTITATSRFAWGGMSEYDASLLPTQAFNWTFSWMWYGPDQGSEWLVEEWGYYYGNYWSRRFKTYHFSVWDPENPGQQMPRDTLARYRVDASVILCAKRDGGLLPAGTSTTVQLVVSSDDWDYETQPPSVDPGGTVVYEGTVVSTGSFPVQYLVTPEFEFVGTLHSLNLYLRILDPVVYDAIGRHAAWQTEVVGDDVLVHLVGIGGSAGAFLRGHATFAAEF